MKRKAQIALSKNMIKDALFKLMETKNLSDITMLEIANEAQVVRMTLYRHFKSKEDILIYCFDGYLNQAIHEINSCPNPTLKDLLNFRFKTLKESPYTLIMAKNNQLNDILNGLEDKKLEHFKDLLPNVTDRYAKDFIISGINTITIRWIEDGMNESYEEITNKIVELIHKLI